MRWISMVAAEQNRFPRYKLIGMFRIIGDAKRKFFNFDYFDDFRPNIRGLGRIVFFK